MVTTSVFSTGYIPESVKLAESDGSRTGFLYVAGDSVDILQQLGFSAPEAADFVENGFWRFVITGLSEDHDEGHVLHNTLSDTVTLFSTGAVPIGINITGFLLTIPGKDDRARFLKLYADRIRGRVLDKTRSALYFGYKDTLMRLYITQMAVTNDAQNEVFTNLIISGVASHYGTYLPKYQKSQQVVNSDVQAGTQSVYNEYNDFELQRA